jgi:hypothetical protein
VGNVPSAAWSAFAGEAMSSTFSLSYVQLAEARSAPSAVATFPASPAAKGTGEPAEASAPSSGLTAIQAQRDHANRLHALPPRASSTAIDSDADAAKRAAAATAAVASAAPPAPTSTPPQTALSYHPVLRQSPSAVAAIAAAALSSSGPLLPTRSLEHPLQQALGSTVDPDDDGTAAAGGGADADEDLYWGGPPIALPPAPLVPRRLPQTQPPPTATDGGHYRSPTSDPVAGRSGAAAAAAIWEELNASTTGVLPGSNRRSGAPSSSGEQSSPTHLLPPTLELPSDGSVHSRASIPIVAPTHPVPRLQRPAPPIATAAAPLHIAAAAPLPPVGAAAGGAMAPPGPPLPSLSQQQQQQLLHGTALASSAAEAVRRKVERLPMGPGLSSAAVSVAATAAALSQQQVSKPARPGHGPRGRPQY